MDARNNNSGLFEMFIAFKIEFLKYKKALK
jgi:hypothetical protein